MKVGITDGDAGITVGRQDGDIDGIIVDGFAVCLDVGLYVRPIDGRTDGLNVGVTIGKNVRATCGSTDGLNVRAAEGKNVGVMMGIKAEFVL